MDIYGHILWINTMNIYIYIIIYVYIYLYIFLYKLLFGFFPLILIHFNSFEQNIWINI